MHAATSLLRKLDSVFHAALRFITGAESRMHHCILYESLDWLSLHQRRKLHMYLFITKALLGKLPFYICNLLTLHINSRCTRSVNVFFRTKFNRTKFGKCAFSAYAPWAWNELQNVINLDTLPTLSTFKCLLYNVLKDTCNCFS